jgi:hypothetical protein
MRIAFRHHWNLELNSSNLAAVLVLNAFRHQRKELVSELVQRRIVLQRTWKVCLEGLVNALIQYVVGKVAA